MYFDGNAIGYFILKSARNQPEKKNTKHTNQMPQKKKTPREGIHTEIQRQYKATCNTAVTSHKIYTGEGNEEASVI